jgi:hypothetical protein
VWWCVLVWVWVLFDEVWEEDEEEECSNAERNGVGR